MPLSIAAYAVIGLNVEPGEYSPWVARLNIGENVMSELRRLNSSWLIPPTNSCGS